MVATSRLLRVETDYFVAGAVWSKIYGIWSCTRSAPILRWMVGMNQHKAKAALLKMGAEYQWVDLPKHRSQNQQPVSFRNGLTGNRRETALARPEQGRKSFDKCPGSNLEPRTDGPMAAPEQFDSTRLAETPTMLYTAAATA